MKLAVPVLALALVAVATPGARGDVVGYEEAKVLALLGGAGDTFGASVAVSGDTAVVGAPGDGSAYVYVRGGSAWSQEDQLVPADGAAQFGTSVAISGDTIVVGARLDSDHGPKSGSAYIFVRSSGAWSQQAKLAANDAAQLDEFGSSVAISGDTVVVAAPFHANVDSTGSAYVFVRVFGSWSQQAELTVSAALAFARSVSAGGDTVVVGCAESACVFVRSFGAWSQQAELTSSDGSVGDGFGGSCSISGDTAVVGARAHDTAGVDQSGAAYVFVRSSGSWSEQAKLTASAPAFQDGFGRSVSISGDTVLVGVPGDDDHGQTSGSAYVFERGGSTWSRQGKLSASDAGGSDAFGASAAISGDAAIVGAPENGAAVGSAYAFGPNGSETCAFATPISGEGSFGFDDIGATTDGIPHFNCFGTFGQVPSDVWYRWTAPCTADVTIETCGTTSVDTRLVVYGSTCPTLNLSHGCGDDDCGSQSRVTFAADAGSTYLIRLGLSGPNDAQGRGRFTISAGCTGACPSQTAASGPSGFTPLAAARVLGGLYRLRERVLRPAPLGRRWIELYYEHAETMSAILRADPALRRRAAALIAVVSPGLDALAEDGAGTSGRIPDHALALLDAVLRGLEDADRGGDLARTLRAERERLDIARLRGATYSEAWRLIEAQPGERR